VADVGADELDELTWAPDTGCRQEADAMPSAAVPAALTKSRRLNLAISLRRVLERKRAPELLVAKCKKRVVDFSAFDERDRSP
jgi:hypothetical protein